MAISKSNVVSDSSMESKDVGAGGKKTVGDIILDNLLIILIVISVGIGVGMGLGLRGQWKPNDYQKIWYLEFPGRILLNMLKMMILPLIVSSLVTGMASLGSHATGKLGGAAVMYYLTTTLCAVIIGIVLVLTIHPGSADDKTRLRQEGKSTDAKPLDSLLDLVSQCFPENLVTACFQRKITKITLVEAGTRYRADGTNYTKMVKKYSLKPSDGTNALGLVVVSIALGIIINRLGEEGIPLKNFFNSLNAASMALITVIVWFTPIGIMFPIAGKFISTKDIAGVLEDLGKYVGTVICGLFIHGFIVLPFLFFVLTNKSPATFALNMSKALFTAWGTASSSATLPITMDCLVNKNKVNLNVVRFVAPVGATINMDGTALYEAVACIFIAQINGKGLEIADVIMVSLTATAAAIGAAGVPQAGLVTLVIVLTAVGLPTEDVTFILSIDWFLDRFRTAINVWGDSIGAGILDHYFRDIVELEASSPPLNVKENDEKEPSNKPVQSIENKPVQSIEDIPPATVTVEQPMKKALVDKNTTEM